MIIIHHDVSQELCCKQIYRIEKGTKNYTQRDVNISIVEVPIAASSLIIPGSLVVAHY